MEENMDTNKVCEELLPTKSKKVYRHHYEAFLKWCNANKVEDYSEEVLLAYFKERSETICSSTLWATYAVLKLTLNNYENVDISKYSKLHAFLKGKSENYTAKKSKILTSEHIERFLKEAPEKNFLAMKVALIMGVVGACKGNELVELSVDDVTVLDSEIKCKIKKSKNGIERNFVIKDIENVDIKFVKICKKYMALRQCKTPHSRFFVQYRDNKCTTQPIGKNIFGKIPQKIATYLNLPDAAQYTGHCFRRTSASLIADSKESMDSWKEGLRSSTFPEGYSENSLDIKKMVAGRIFGEQEGPSTSKEVEDNNEGIGEEIEGVFLNEELDSPIDAASPSFDDGGLEPMQTSEITNNDRQTEKNRTFVEHIYQVLMELPPSKANQVRHKIYNILFQAEEESETFVNQIGSGSNTFDSEVEIKYENL